MTTLRSISRVKQSNGALETRGIRVKSMLGAQDDRDVIYQHFLMIYNFLVIIALSWRCQRHWAYPPPSP